MCWADVTTGGFLLVWGVGALQNNNINDVLCRYYSIQYLNISIIHLPCPQSACPLRCCPAAGQLVSARPSFPSYKYSELQPPVLATVANTTRRPSGKSSSRKSLVSSLSSGQSAHTLSLHLSITSVCVCTTPLLQRTIKYFFCILLTLPLSLLNVKMEFML